MAGYDKALAAMIAGKDSHDLDAIKRMDREFETSISPDQLNLAGEYALVRERRAFLDDVAAFEED